MHSPTTLTYQLFGSKIKLTAISLFIWSPFLIEKNNFDFHVFIHADPVKNPETEDIPS